MADCDLQVFVGTFNAELEQFHPTWNSRIDAGAKRTGVQLWADGYILKLDLTENHLEPGELGKGSRKYDQLRMMILRDSREPMDVDTWRSGAEETVVKRFWQSVKHGNEIRWHDETGNDITIEQVFSAIRAEMCGVVEERS